MGSSNRNEAQKVTARLPVGGSWVRAWLQCVFSVGKGDPYLPVQSALRGEQISVKVTFLSSQLRAVHGVPYPRSFPVHANSDNRTQTGLPPPGNLVTRGLDYFAPDTGLGTSFGFPRVLWKTLRGKQDNLSRPPSGADSTRLPPIHGKRNKVFASTPVRSLRSNPLLSPPFSQCREEDTEGRPWSTFVFERRAGKPPSTLKRGGTLKKMHQLQIQQCLAQTIHMMKDWSCQKLRPQLYVRHASYYECALG